MSLKDYIRKRNFKKTAEPTAKIGRDRADSFVIQKHDASRLHYDFRLALDGTLKSWAIPKGFPFKHGEKRLAVQVEDHPIAYADFEGTIPKGQYGGGTVMVWDRGTYKPFSKTPARDLKNGKLHFILHGKKLKGEWYLVRFHGEDNQWLIIRGGEDMKPVTKKADDTSVISGKTMKQLSQGDRVWQSKPVRKRIGPRSQSTPAAPFPEFVEPMKAKLAASAPRGDWFYEIKFDGWRAMGLKGRSQSRLLSRNKKDFESKFPEVLESIAQINAQDAILDGEIVALDDKGVSSFQLLQAYDIGTERPPIYYYAFDLLQLNGKDLKKSSVVERKTALQKLLKKSPGVIRYSASLGNDSEVLLKQARDVGLEGLIGKEEDSVYEPGQRSGAWIKLKLNCEQEFVIGGYTKPEGTRQFFGSIIVGVYEGNELKFVAKVGTGFDSKILRSLYKKFQKIKSDTCPFSNLPQPRGSKWGQAITAAKMKNCHWLDPKMVCQVKFSEWTRDNHIRQPVFLGLREDIDPRDVVRETPS